MTVAELIRELQAMPQQLPVQIFLNSCAVDAEEEGDYHNIYFDESTAVPADEVKFEGAFVMIRGLE